MNIYYKYLIISVSYEFARIYFIYYDYKNTKNKIYNILCSPILFFYNIYYDLFDIRDYRITKIL